ncbi:insulinase family protein [Aliivibrio finisterrensis]|uniref:Insulinase family protein n=1 Tax=Aliivibrio finisterrensis TaxID=511998 RepID=A0A4Q5KJ06_9GAMM|nr:MULTISPECIES: insulinase family protein [Aliivibrio]MDD9175062.1 insulinase family protein [Aliivibrio sp. S3TY1]MDD9191991.1 insulinase family protein [Aliivibrio sp. S2TY2]RYU46178.1 insulinase family protein [Aliivibrio finisterrensis]
MKHYWLAFIAFLFISGCATTSVTELKSDPRWVSGQLDNGFRYHIYPDREKEVSIRFIVHAGSFQETENQKGYAHFVEHMAFNGSEHFSQNDVISLFENAGLRFGADINAYTSYEETVYKLDLPNNSEINNAFTWMRDIADGIELSSTEVEKEKEVILGEFRHARLEDKPISAQFYEHVIEGTIYESNDPIGNKESVLSTSSTRLSEFYNQWYQPQLAEIIISGDITLENAIKLITEHFESWKKGTSTVSLKPLEALNQNNFIGKVASGEAPSIAIVIDRGDFRTNTREEQHQLWLDEIAHSIIQQRLGGVYLDAAMPVQWIYSTDYYASDQRYFISSVSFPANYRTQSQQLFLETLASLRDHGVSYSELDNLLQPYHHQLDNLDANREKLTPYDHVENRVNGIVSQQISQSSLDYKASLKTFLAATDLKAINDHIDELLSSSYQFAIGVDSVESMAQIESSIPELKSIYAKSGNEPLINNVSAAFPVPMTSGTILSEIQLSDELDLTRWTLDNGVNVLYLRKLDAGDEVVFSLASKGGIAALPSELIPAANIAVPTVTRSGIGKFTGSQLDSHLRNRGIELYPFINFTHHGIEGITDKEGLAETFAVLATIMSEINVDEEQLKAVKQEFEQNRSAYISTSLGQFTKAINRNTFPSTSRHQLLDGDGVNTVTSDQIKRVHHLLFHQNRNYQLVVVANLKPSELKPLLRQYIASMKLSSADKTDYALTYKSDPVLSMTMAVNTEQNSHYLAQFISEQSIENKSAKSIFMEDMLQRIISKRVMHYVREELSLDYAPYAVMVNADSEFKPHWLIGAQVAPKNAELIESAVNKVIEELLKGVTDSEVNAAAKQLVVDLESLKDNSVQQAWFLNRYTIHSYGIEALFDIPKTANSVNAEDINRLIKSSFGKNSRQIKYLATPI